jgi:hypothetical protein
VRAIQIASTTNSVIAVINLNVNILWFSFMFSSFVPLAALREFALSYGSGKFPHLRWRLAIMERNRVIISHGLE